ncbi:MAG: preprotein translocase subunit YajC [Chloroflexi bacterium]|nr:preprotein translocase subunit YajC [Chloroflexota bacterium]
MNPLLTLVGFAAFFVLMIYLMMVRPLRQREKQHDQMVEELQPGDVVITAGGVFGKVDKVDEGSIVLEIESGAKMRVTKGGVLKREE